MIFLSSYWINSTENLGKFEKIDNNYNADVCIIGAGMCGLSCGYYLAKAGFKVIILDKNNIIYGHNMYYSGVMFGTLYKTANSSWYTNPDNQIITYNTLYENMEFRIFSIYRVPDTNDYLRVYFDGDNDFLGFIDMITKRSIYNFNVPVNADDKIITLSTCSNNGTKRLVIHAVLINE